MKARLDDVVMCGLCAAVPSNIDEVRGTTDAQRRFSAATGINRRRICPPDMFFSDLALAAGDRLLSELAWERGDVSALVLVTQSGDVAFPSTACILQHRLGLSSDCAAFDINLGCSGFPYGMLVAGRLVGPESGSKVLLIIGDAAGKPNPALPQPPLFGDAAVAVALERRAGVSSMMFSLHTDGAGCDFIMERRSGGKPGLDPDVFTTATDSLGSVHINTQYQIRGEDVFNFSVRAVPVAVRQALHERDWAADSIDAFVFHQASRLINEALRKSLGLDAEKTPSTLANFGNTSSATIPLTLVDQLGSRLRGETLRLLLCGFGVGLSWGTLTCEAGPLVCPPILEI
jgi:3-oxoacyl-[acyl-carrier-protein] synthase-3